MSISPEYIEAEIAAEVKRIKAWNNNNEPACTLCDDVDESLCSHEIHSLANDIVCKRLQVEDAQVKALVQALTVLLNAVEEEGWGGDEMKAAEAALAPFKEVTP